MLQSLGEVSFPALPTFPVSGKTGLVHPTTEVSMRRIMTGPALLAAAVWVLPASVDAAGPAKPPAKEEDEPMVIEDDMEGQPAPAEGKAAGQPSGQTGGDIDALLGGPPKKTGAASSAGGETGDVGTADRDSERKQIDADQKFITVVQRQRFLKRKRVDIQPQVGISVNDPFVRHYGFGAELNYWITNRLAIGLSGMGYIGAKTSRYNNIRFQEGVLLTANRVLWTAGLNILYNPFYGKIALFNRALLHWESYAQLGGGAVQTEVLPRFGSLHEPFRNLTGQGNATLGVRFYGSRINWLSVNAGIRLYVFPDKYEPRLRGPDTGPGGADDIDLIPADAAKEAAENRLAYNAMLFIGVSFYIPTKFEYTTRR